MKGLLDIDGRLYGVLSLIADVVIVNLLVVASLIPVVTGGAGVSAALYLFRRRIDGDSVALLETFVAQVRKNFAVTWSAWLVFLAATALTFYEFAVLGQVDNTPVTLALRALLIVAYLMVSAFVLWYFVLAGGGPETVRWLAKSCVLLSLAYLPRTGLAMLVVVVPVVAACLSLALLVRLSGFYLVIGIGFTLYLQALALHRPVVDLGCD